MLKRFSSSESCFCGGFFAGQDSVPAGGEERSGEPEERSGQKNQNVRIRFKTGKVGIESRKNLVAEQMNVSASLKFVFPSQGKISQVKIWKRVKPRRDEDAQF